MESITPFRFKGALKGTSILPSSRGHLSSLVFAAVITGVTSIIFNNIAKWSFPAANGNAMEVVSPYTFFAVLLAGVVFLAAYLYFLRRRMNDETLEKALRRAEFLRDGFLDAARYINQAIVIIDKEYHVLHMNPAAEKLMAMKYDSFQGKRFQEIWPSGAIIFDADSDKAEIALHAGPGRQVRIHKIAIPDPASAGVYRGWVLLLREGKGKTAVSEGTPHAGKIHYTIDGTIKHIDAGCLKILNLDDVYPDTDEVVGKNISELVMYTNTFRAIQRKILTEPNFNNLEFCFTTMGGIQKWASLYSHIDIDPETGDKIIRSVWKDITALKTVEKELSEKSFFLDNILGHILDLGLIVTDPIFRIKLANPTAGKILAYPPSELLGKSIIDLLIRDKIDPAGIEKALMGVRNGGEHLFTIRKKINGDIRTMASRMRAMRDDSGRILGYFFALRDNTDSDLLARDLNQQRQISNFALQCLPYPYYIINVENHQVEMSNRVLPDMPIQRTCHRLLHGTPEPCRGIDGNCPTEEIKKTGRTITVIHRHRDSRGLATLVRIQAGPVTDNQGKVTHIVEYALDAADNTTERMTIQTAAERIFESYSDYSRS